MPKVTRRALLTSMAAVASACGIKTAEQGIMSFDPKRTTCFVVYVDGVLHPATRAQFMSVWTAMVKDTDAENIPVLFLDQKMKLGVLEGKMHKV